MTPPDANERWTQRILGGLGVRPVGHQDPNTGDPSKAPAAPAAPPAAAPAAPTVPVQRGNQLPDWWKPQKPAVDASGPQVPVTDADDATEDEATPENADDTPQDNDTDVDDQDENKKEDTVSGPAPATPVEKIATDSKGRPGRKTSVRKTAEEATDDPRLRILLFNGTAAAVGYAAGLVGMVKEYLPAAEQAATGVFGFALAVVAGWLAWKVLGNDTVQHVLPYAPIARLLGVAAAAEVARRLAPVPVAYATAYGQEYGLGPSAISLLLTAGGICGGLWWAIDRPLRHHHWAVRWFFRIPLASALLACVPYTGVPVV